MLGEKEEHDIFVGVGFVQIDFTGQGSLWKIKGKNECPDQESNLGL